MRDQFVADVNDFGKYGLLRRLCGITRDGDDDEHDPDLKLGVVWYYLTGEAPNGGGNTDYPKLAHCDPALYAKLQKLLTSQANRTVVNVEKLNFLRAEGRYYHTENPIWGAPNNKPTQRKTRLAKADQWVDGAIERVRGADVVFLDPDNKIAEGGSRIGKNGPMFAHTDEIKKFWKQGHSLVIYHQTATSPTGRDLVSITVKAIQREIPDAAIDALHFKKANRKLVFFVLSQECHRIQIRERIDAMLNGAWHEYFKLLHRGPAAADDISQAAN